MKFALAIIVLCFSTVGAAGQTEVDEGRAGQTLRIATFHTELSRKGPGLLLRDILRGTDPQVEAVLTVIARANADILILQGLDWDFEGRTLAALIDALDVAGVRYPSSFGRQPNSGLATKLDLDGDGRTGDPSDAQGYGSFTGQGSLAVLSKYPIESDSVTDLTALLWKDMPGAQMPVHTDGSPFPSAEAWQIQRLSNTNHWVVPIRIRADWILDLMTFHAAPPVFDGPEDRNGLRNHDEIALWSLVLDGHMPPKPSHPYVLAGSANLDPERSDGRREAIRALLERPDLQDPRPQSTKGGLNTVEWAQTGPLRVDYILPSREMTVIDAGVVWPEDSDHVAQRASRHRLVWIDIRLPE